MKFKSLIIIGLCIISPAVQANDTRNANDYMLFQMQMKLNKLNAKLAGEVAQQAQRDAVLQSCKNSFKVFGASFCAYILTMMFAEIADVDLYVINAKQEAKKPLTFGENFCVGIMALETFIGLGSFCWGAFRGIQSLASTDTNIAQTEEEIAQLSMQYQNLLAQQQSQQAETA